MTKNNIEEGEVLERKSYKKKVFLAVISFISIVSVFYFFMRHDLIDKLKVEQLDEKSLNNSPKYNNLSNSSSDYSNELSRIKLQVKKLSTENQNFEARLTALAKELNQINMISNDEPKGLVTKKAVIKMNQVLEPILYSLDGNLKNGENLKSIQSNFDKLILVLSLFSPDIDGLILTEVEKIKTTTENELGKFINQIDSELITVHNELWSFIASNSNGDSFSNVKKADNDKERQISRELEESPSLRKKIKAEIMKFIDIEPLDNRVALHNLNLDRLRIITELSVKISFARTLLLNLEFKKLNSYLSELRSNLELYFPGMVNSKSSIDRISKKLDNFRLEVEELDKVRSLLETNIKEQ